MTLPSFALGLIYSLLIGALFHLWQDGGPGRLLYYLTLSVIGFFAGQWIGTWRNWMLYPVGPLDLGVATIGSLIFLGVGYWLGLIDSRRTNGHDERV